MRLAAYSNSIQSQPRDLRRARWRAGPSFPQKIQKGTGERQSRTRAQDLMSAENSRMSLADEQALPALAQDAVVWASQHGLVRPACSSINFNEPIKNPPTFHSSAVDDITSSTGRST